MAWRYMIVTDRNLDEAVKNTRYSREELLTLIDNSYAKTRFRRVKIPLKRKKKT